MSNEEKLPKRIEEIYYRCSRCVPDYYLFNDQYKCPECGQEHLSPKVIYAVREDDK